MAHPALQDLYGFTYHDLFYDNDLRVSKGTYKPGAGRLWSVRNYVKLSQGQDSLPAERHTLWAYYGLFPNSVFITTPETVQFYQELPIDANRSLVRGVELLAATAAAERPQALRSGEIRKQLCDLVYGFLTVAP